MKWHTATMANIENAWTTYLEGLEKSLDMLEKDINEAKVMQGVCTDEWCAATEHVLDEIANSLFSIHEPITSPKVDSAKIKELKHRVHELYATYKP